MSRRFAWLLGQPVAHSLSPALHNPAFAAAHLNACYAVRETSPEELARVIEDLRSPLCLGANVTAPHKQAVLSLLDDVSDAAHALGAVNTIVNQTGRLVGHNTDASGLARWLRASGIDARGKRALVLGAGGAARACVWALADHEARSVCVLNRTEDRAEALVRSLQGQLRDVQMSSGPIGAAALLNSEPFDVVINATSLGHHGRAPDVHPSCYSPDSVAIELVYNPPVTEFMRAARQAGAGRTENGLGMLVHQAALAFECWTGQPAPLDVYERAARESA